MRWNLRRRGEGGSRSRNSVTIFERANSRDTKIEIRNIARGRWKDSGAGRFEWLEEFVGGGLSLGERQGSQGRIGEGSKLRVLGIPDAIPGEGTGLDWE